MTVAVQLSPTLLKDAGTPAMSSNNVVDDSSQQHLKLDTEEIHEDLHYTIIEDKTRNVGVAMTAAPLLTAACFTLSSVTFSWLF